MFYLYHISHSWAALTSAKKVNCQGLMLKGRRGELVLCEAERWGRGGWLNNFAPEFATLVKEWRVTGPGDGWYQNPAPGSVNFQGQVSLSFVNWIKCVKSASSRDKNPIHMPACAEYLSIYLPCLIHHSDLKRFVLILNDKRNWKLKILQVNWKYYISVFW